MKPGHALPRPAKFESTSRPAAQLRPAWRGKQKPGHPASECPGDRRRAAAASPIQRPSAGTLQLLTLRFTLTGMRRVLITGMSGTGKSSALVALGRLGFQVVDTDEPGWTEWSDDEGGYVWREHRITELLAREGGPSLYVSGTVSNQGRFYARFDAVVLLSAPAGVLLRRIENWTTNSYGKSREQRELILRDLAEADPRLRRTCTHEIDTTQPLTSIVDQLAKLGREPPA